MEGGIKGYQRCCCNQNCKIQSGRNFAIKSVENNRFRHSNDETCTSAHLFKISTLDRNTSSRRQKSKS